jgi:hypothetical protein
MPFILFDPKSKEYFTGKYNKTSPDKWSADINKAKTFANTASAKSCKTNNGRYWGSEEPHCTWFLRAMKHQRAEIKEAKITVETM